MIGTDHLRTSPTELRHLLRAEAITVALLSTAVFHQIAAADPAVFFGLHEVVVGGDVLDPGLARAVLTASTVRLTNGYGPTEGTVFATAHRIESVPDEAATVPIGRPIAGTICHIRRPDDTPAGLGERGELLIGGPGIAAGYLNDAALTADRFIDDPHADGARLYRTGDIVYRRGDGTLEFCGRADGQVKVRGNRVEPGEVEHALRAVRGVGEAAVVRLDGGAVGGEMLIAYLTATGDDRPGDEQLRELLGERLLPAAIPAAYVWRDRLPLTLHGKLDRTALAQLPPPAAALQATDGAAGVLEQIQAIWAQATGAERIDVDQTLFESGGTSEHIPVVHARVRAAFSLGDDLTPLDLFAHPRLGAYAAHVAVLVDAR